MNDIYWQLKQLLGQYQRLLLITHRRPDEDAVGSVLALRAYLLSLKKEVGVFSALSSGSVLSYFPDNDQISENQEILQENWDACVLLDCGSLSQTGLPESFFIDKKIINIDHHISNPGYGFFNLIDLSASSTCEIIFDFFSVNNFLLTRRIAICLLAGILGDTSGFIHSNTSSKTVQIASQLMRQGARVGQLLDFSFRNKNINSLRLWGMVLSRLKYRADYDLAYAWVTIEDLEKYQVQEDEIGGLANFLNVIVDAGVVAFFKIGSDGFKSSWRTKREDVDLSAWCSQFGGGGHKKASGFAGNWKIIEKDGDLVLL